MFTLCVIICFLTSNKNKVHFILEQAKKQNRRRLQKKVRSVFLTGDISDNPYFSVYIKNTHLTHTHTRIHVFLYTTNCGGMV